MTMASRHDVRMLTRTPPFLTSISLTGAFIHNTIIKLKAILLMLAQRNLSQIKVIISCEVCCFNGCGTKIINKHTLLLK